jgi:hypothetical protein
MKRITATATAALHAAGFTMDQENVAAHKSTTSKLETTVFTRTNTP